MTPQGSTDRTLALPPPPHAIRLVVRSTAFRVACWAGASSLGSPSRSRRARSRCDDDPAPSMTADRADRAAARSAILRSSSP
jgi:hypothetical protein